MNPVLIKSGIPDIPHWVKQLYISCLGVFQPGTLNPEPLNRGYMNLTKKNLILLVIIGILVSGIPAVTLCSSYCVSNAPTSILPWTEAALFSPFICPDCHWVVSSFCFAACRSFSCQGPAIHTARSLLALFRPLDFPTE